MLCSARAHSSGCNALNTKTRTMMSTLPSVRSVGNPSVEVRSHTADDIEPVGGF
jgi:hypothetical protein